MDETVDSVDLFEGAEVTEAEGAMGTQSTRSSEEVREICRKGIVDWTALEFWWNPHRRGNNINVSEDSEDLIYPCPSSYCGCPDTNRLPGTWGYPALPRDHPSKWLLRVTVDIKGSDPDTMFCEVGVGNDYALFPESYLSKAKEDRYIKSVWTLSLSDLGPFSDSGNKFVRDIAFLYEPNESRLYMLLLSERWEVSFIQHCVVGPDVELWPLACIVPQCDCVKIKISILRRISDIKFPYDSDVKELPPIHAIQENMVTG